MLILLHLLSGTAAFLLFSLEPLIAKAILPWFGGGAGVWTTCMLFFQVTLLAGYAYANATTVRLSGGSQARLHAGLLALSLLLLPILPSSRWKPLGAEDPELRILGLLTESIGLPFLLLSATSPLLQVWASRLRPGVSPFPLYASSNLGSLLALLAYPVLVEPSLGIASQGRIWSAAYAGFAVLLGIVALRGGGVSSFAMAAASAGVPVPARVWLLWLALPACASSLLLAVTNELCQDVASVPFLWIAPLSVYLLSFILCFQSDRWYPRRWWLRAMALTFAMMTYLSVSPFELPLRASIAAYVAALFVACMVCHGELARLRPAPARLTAFYLASSLGGALGAVFVGVVAPRVFTSYWELRIAAAAVIPLALLAAAEDPASPAARAGGAPARRLAAAMAAAMALLVALEVRVRSSETLLAARNFYGVVRVADHDKGPLRVRSLLHGAINHGSQILDGARRREPITYYGPGTGVALAFARHPKPAERRIGVVGLGIGTIAAFGRPGDTIRFYEINPLVIEIARRDFTLLSDSPAQIDVVVGDGRLRLEREAPQQFDLLVADAFSSDSIPMHLLTFEAFQVYRRHLAPGGVLVVNVSNRFVDVRPVVVAAARRFGWRSAVVVTPEDPSRALSAATWVLAGPEPAFFEDPEIRAASVPFDGREIDWSDDRTSLFQVLH